MNTDGQCVRQFPQSNTRRSLSAKYSTIFVSSPLMLHWRARSSRSSPNAPPWPSLECHLTDTTDPSCFVLDAMRHADLLARLGLSIHKQVENDIRLLSAQELQASVYAFLDLRPDGYAIHQKIKRLAILEFTRAMDSSEDWEDKKDAEKRVRYAPVLEFFNTSHDRKGLTMVQFNFTVGVRGSISNVDRTEPLSFLSTLKAFGIASRVNREKIRKVVAKRIFEAHDLMLRSYYAIKFSSSSQVDFYTPILTTRCEKPYTSTG
jgi:hypothetical protein